MYFNISKENVEFTLGKKKWKICLLFTKNFEDVRLVTSGKHLNVIQAYTSSKGTKKNLQIFYGFK